MKTITLKNLQELVNENFQNSDLPYIVDNFLAWMVENPSSETTEGFLNRLQVENVESLIDIDWGLETEFAENWIDENDEVSWEIYNL